MKKQKHTGWSKRLTLLVVVLGFIISQECLALMWLAISKGFTATASWLTAAVGLAETVLITGVNGYLSLCKVDHRRGGITHDAAEARNYTEDSI